MAGLGRCAGHAPPWLRLPRHPGGGEGICRYRLGLTVCTCATTATTATAATAAAAADDGDDGGDAMSLTMTVAHLAGS